VSKAEQLTLPRELGTLDNGNKEVCQARWWYKVTRELEVAFGDVFVHVYYIAHWMDWKAQREEVRAMRRTMVSMKRQ
jgi:NTP pyrophosphatase (non-canonical NTP hydrolase)